jgi:hypothetical protein
MKRRICPAIPDETEILLGKVMETIGEERV